MNWSEREWAEARATVASWEPQKQEEFRDFVDIVNYCSNLISEYCDSVDADTVREAVKEITFRVGDAFLDDSVRQNINSLCEAILLKHCKNMDKSVVSGVVEKVLGKLNLFYQVSVGRMMDEDL